MPRILLITSIICLLLSGCVQGGLDVTVNRDGSGSYQWKVLTDMRAQSYIRLLTTIYSKRGYEAKLIHERGRVGFIANKPVANIAKQPLNKEISNALPTELKLPGSNAATPVTTTVSLPKELTIEPSFWETTLRYQTNVDLRQRIQSLAGSYADYIERMLNQQTFRFSLSLPIAPSIHNATTVSNHGKTLTWQLKLGQANSILLGAKLPTPLILLLAATNGLTEYVPQFWQWTTIWLLCIAVVLFAIISGIRLLLRRKKA